MQQRLFLYASVLALALGGAAASHAAGDQGGSSAGTSAGAGAGTQPGASDTGTAGAAANQPENGRSADPFVSPQPPGARTEEEFRPGFGERQPTPGFGPYRTAEPTDTAPVVGTMTAADLRGAEVVTADGENVGPVEEVLTDETGEARRLLIDVGGFLGIGERRVAIDPANFRVEGDQVVLDMTREELEAMPSFESDEQGWWRGQSQ